ncbi:MAG: hypothetical protein M3N22_01870, partial [Acidobacteriota bacterium]|nr:hypothetical protein [Acidobacteriota bacterium]
MPTKTRTKKSSVTPQQHPIRVVPLHRPEIAGAPPASPTTTPNLTYRNGPLLTAVEVFTIFWGAPWQQPQNSTLSTQLNQFFDFI